MQLKDFAEHLEAEVTAIVAKATARAAELIRSGTPANAKRTRAAVFHRAAGHTGIVGLRFARQYAAAGTATQKRLIRQWRAIRPLLRQEIIEQLNNVLQG